mmetsp:Transcript_27691/g.50814  ORF Transcript_27691/g.50814 Transcript_27691/m.50814 type:complete len:125 (-) Transcript_27691:2-376(-)
MARWRLWRCTTFAARNGGNEPPELLHEAEANVHSISVPVRSPMQVLAACLCKQKAVTSCSQSQRTAMMLAPPALQRRMLPAGRAATAPRRGVGTLRSTGRGIVGERREAASEAGGTSAPQGIGG